MGLSREMFGKKVKDLTDEERKAYQRRRYEISIKPFHLHYTTTQSYLLFGKRERDLTLEEYHELQHYRTMKSSRYKAKAENSMAVKLFGKRVKDMTAVEKRLYWKNRKQLHRKRKLEGTLPGRGYCIIGE